MAGVWIDQLCIHCYSSVCCLEGRLTMFDVSGISEVEQLVNQNNSTENGGKSQLLCFMISCLMTC